MAYTEKNDFTLHLIERDPKYFQQLFLRAFQIGPPRSISDLLDFRSARIRICLHSNLPARYQIC